MLRGELKTNADVFQFTMDEGHIVSHAVEEIRKMKKEKLISYDSSSPLINYEQVCQKHNIITYKVL